jgi:hypothetical protein
MQDLILLKKWLIHGSIGTSAVRNQGNGISAPIRDTLVDILSLDDLFKSIRHPRAGSFERYLDTLTDALTGLKGVSTNGKPPGRVRWGTARKCVNLVLRSITYNAWIWEAYNVKPREFSVAGPMSGLELPLDSYVAKGIRKDCTEKHLAIGFDRKRYPSFSIIRLDKRIESPYYQEKAAAIAAAKRCCRIHLDVRYWRNLEEDEDD